MLPAKFAQGETNSFQALEATGDLQIFNDAVELEFNQCKTRILPKVAVVDASLIGRGCAICTPIKSAVKFSRPL